MKKWIPRLFVALILGLAFWGLPRAEAKKESGDNVVLQNPVKATAASIAKGKDLFAKDCATCHGLKANGNTPTGKALNPPASNLTDAAWKHGGTDGEIFTTITKGIAGTGMTPWEKSVLEKDRWNLVNYIKTMGPKKIEATTKAAKVVYTCPMHPEVVSEVPGKCPKCGMDLVKKGS
jgi:mono/diheme cytochrome c family protein